MRNVGAYRDRVTIQERVTTVTALGTTEVWTTIQSRWARVVEITTNGRAAYQQIGHDDVTHKIVFRGDVDIDMTDKRFVWKGDRYEAIEPKNDPDGIGKNSMIVVRKVPENVES